MCVCIVRTTATRARALRARRAHRVRVSRRQRNDAQLFQLALLRWRQRRQRRLSRHEVGKRAVRENLQELVVRLEAVVLRQLRSQTQGVVVSETRACLCGLPHREPPSPHTQQRHIYIQTPATDTLQRCTHNARNCFHRIERQELAKHKDVGLLQHLANERDQRRARRLGRRRQKLSLRLHSRPKYCAAV